jgi:multicomponent K+:H+ antiporter subunit D
VSHLPVLPILVPAAAAILMLLAGPERIRLQRRLAILACVALAVVAGLLFARAATGEVMVYALGDWPAPFGIVLVIDRLAALMLALLAAVALPVLRYASAGWDTHGKHFHALFQFQLMGLAGAFSTGDLFNLFVFFEVLLIASYCLLLHGLGGARLRAGVHYVVLNLAASSLFLIGVSLLYSVTGTLNMAELALRVAALPEADAPIAKAAALILLVVFGLKAAIVPLHLWLPATYAAASAPTAALFAIMTKVGIYAIVRVHVAIFGVEAGPAAMVAAPLLLPLALITSVLGVLGALAARTLSSMIAYLTVSSVGTILTGVGLFSDAGLGAALFYLVHSTLVVAALFLLAEVVAAQRGDAADRLEPAAPVAQPAVLGTVLVLGAMSVAGAPPLTGFIGKIMLLESARDAHGAVWIWITLLGTSLLGLVGMARAGSILFWQVRPESAAAGSAGFSGRLLMQPLVLLAAVVGITVFAAPVKHYADAAAAQVRAPRTYAAPVLGTPEGRPGSARALKATRP